MRGFILKWKHLYRRRNLRKVELHPIYWFFPNCVKPNGKEFYTKLKHSNLYVVNYEQNLLKINFSWSSNGKSTTNIFFRAKKIRRRRIEKQWAEISQFSWIIDWWPKNIFLLFLRHFLSFLDFVKTCIILYFG